MDQRRHRRVVVARVAEDVLVGETVEELEERLDDRLLHEDAGAGEADLAGVVELSRSLPRRRLEVAVLEDEQRPLAAELAGERDDVLRCGDADVPRRLRRAGERDPAHVRVRDERGPDLLADPLHDVEHARRKLRLGDEVREQRARERRPLGRLEDHGRACREGGGRLPGREHERRVPGRDHDRRPARHPDHPVVGAVRIPDALLVRDREIGVAPVVARAAVDQARLQRAEQHRHVDALDGCEPLDVGVDQVGEPVEILGPAGSAEGGPGRECSRRRGDGQIGLPLAAARDLAERLLVDRRDVGERARAGDALAADEVVRRDLDAGHGDAVAHRTSSKTCAPASTIETPPSRGITAPFRYDASSERSQAIAPAISSGELGLRSGASAVAAM